MTAQQCCNELRDWTASHGGTENRFVLGSTGCCTLVSLAGDATTTLVAPKGFEGSGAGLGALE